MSNRTAARRGTTGRAVAAALALILTAALLVTATGPARADAPATGTAATATATATATTKPCGAGRAITYSGPATLWPPDQLPHRVQVAVTDDSGQVVRLTTAVTHDEVATTTPVESHVGYAAVRDIDPVTAVVAGAEREAMVQHDLKAMRWSLGDGRTYSIDATAVFADQTTCSTRFTTTVPLDEPAGQSVLPLSWDLATAADVTRQRGHRTPSGWQTDPADAAGYVFLLGTHGGMQGRVRLELPVTLVGSRAANHELATVHVVDIQDTSTFVAQGDLYSHMYEADGGTVTLTVPWDARPDRLYEVYVSTAARTSLGWSTLRIVDDETASAATWAAGDPALTHGTGAAQDRGWLAQPGIDLPGVLVDGPGVEVAGTNRAVVRLRAQDLTSRTHTITNNPLPAATIAVLVGDVAVATRPVHVEDFVQAGVPQDFGVDFTATPGHPVDVRVEWAGTTPLRHDETRIEDPRWPQRWPATGGEVAHDTGSPGSGVWHAQPGVDAAGLLASGPAGTDSMDLYGTGQAVFQLAVEGAPAPSTPVATIAVVRGSTTLVSRNLTAADFDHDGRLQDHRLAYLAAKGVPVRLTVRWAGAVATSVGELRVEDRELSSNPGFAEVWGGTADIVTSAANPMGRSPSSHIADMQVVAAGSLVYAYYTTPDGTTRLKQRGQSGSIGLAISSDGGRTFVPHRGGRPVVEAGLPGDFDSLYMVSPSVVRNGDEFVMVYEGYGGVYGEDLSAVERMLSPYDAGFPSGHGPPTLGWATSPDGITWTKRGVIPRDLAWTSWESLGTGSPNLTLWNGTFHLWYTGFRYPDYSLARGFSSGPSLDRMVKEPTNPVLEVQPGGWDRGAIGRTSVSYDGEHYWAWYEGGLDPWCNPDSRWGVGVARSTDMRTWHRFAGNPIHVMPEAGACWSAFASSAVLDGKRAPIWLSKQVLAMRDEIRAR